MRKLLRQQYLKNISYTNNQQEKKNTETPKIEAENMLAKTKNKLKTVSEKVAELIANDGSEESEDDEVPRLADFDDEYEAPPQQSTEIRKRNVKLLSEQSARYRGKIATRKDFADEDDQESHGSEEGDAQNVKDSEGEQDDEDDCGAEESDEDSDEGDNSESDDESTVDDDGGAAAVGDIISETNRQAEVQKGVSVQNQLRVWEKLLEVRINAQKLLSKTNQLPEDFQSQCAEHVELQHAAEETAAKAGSLLKALLELQTTLCGQFSEMRGAMKCTLKRPAPFSDPRNSDGCGPPPTKRIGEHLEAHFTEIRSYRNAVLLKWDDRTKLLTPGAGVKKKTLNEEFDVVRKIENALMQRSALVEKSQILKSVTPTESVRGLLRELAPNANVYDDSDFYHQQLRELIEYKANTSANMSEVTKQFVELQKLRHKMKKKVDTRASKGRKLRYIVHNKLINFMAPDDKSTWTLESTDELCKSLFAA